MKRTTVFLPDDLHEQLRRAAFQQKTSMAELIRTRLRGATSKRSTSRASEDPILKVAGICRGPVISGDIDESLYGG